MKNKLLIFILTICFSTGYAQRKAEFEMYFYFEDAAGYRDTIFFRADSSIIDIDTIFNDGLNPEWGETIDNSAFWFWIFR